MKNTLLLIISFFVLYPAFGTNYISKPTGQYAVGFQDFYFVNGTLISERNTKDYYSCPGNIDLFYMKGVNEKDFAKNNRVDFCREMLARVYYPVEKKEGLKYEKYNKNGINIIQDILRNKSVNIPEMTEDKLKELETIHTFSVDFNGKTTNIVNKKFPVLIFSPGVDYLSQNYEDFIENAVSHGYIVLGVNNTFIPIQLQFPDGRVVTPNFSIIPTEALSYILSQSVLNDILFTKNVILNRENNLLPEFIDHMQLDHIGVFGHSISGYPIMKIARDKPSLFQAYSYLDSGPYAFGKYGYDPSALAGYQVPFLRMNASYWNDPQIRELLQIPLDVRPFELFKHNYYVLLSPSEKNYTYSGHMSFSDYITLQYHPTMQIFAEKFPLDVGDANGWFQVHIVNEYLLQFFDQYLKNEPSENLSKCAPLTQDAIFECGR